MRPLRAPGSPIPAVWHEKHRGGCTVLVQNADTFREEVEGWHRVLGLVQRLPYAQRLANIAAGRVVLNLGGTPEHTVAFRVVRWEPQTVTLVLRYELIAAACACYPFWYI